MAYTSYTTLAEADEYFGTRLHVTPWTEADDPTQTKALIEAARIINKFQYKGSKLESDQEHEFPRSGYCDTVESEIPQAIKFAEWEIALALLDGIDVESEIRNLRVVSRGFSSVRTTYSSNSVPEHLLAGVPSAVAWSYIKPYLRDAESVLLSRVS